MVLIVDERTPVVHFRLNRPQCHHALNHELIATLTQAYTQYAYREDIQVITLRSSGPIFSAGADLADMKNGIHASLEENYQQAKALSQLFKAIYSSPKMTVAAIQGHAFGGGIGLFAASDMAIGVKESTFCFSEASLGLAPAVISPYILSRAPTQVVKRWFLTANRFDAHEAHQYQILDDVVPLEVLDDAVEEISQRWQMLSPSGLYASKQLLQKHAPAHHNEEALIQMIAQLRTTEDAQKRLSAFLNKKSAR